MLEEGLQHISLLRLVGLGIALLIGRHQWQAVVEKRRIEALGGAAAARKQWLPWGIDWIIQAFYYIQRHQDLRLWQNLFRQHGRPANPYTVEFRVAGDRYVFTADPDNTKALLAAQFADFGKGPQFRDEWYPFLGDSIFSVDGDSWHTSRALIRPQFVKDRVSDLDTFENHVRVLFSFLQDGQTVNIADLFFRYTLDAATDFLLGRSVDSLRNPQVKFARAFQEVQTLHSLMARIG